MRALNKNQTLELLRQGAIIEVDRRLSYSIDIRVEHVWKGAVGKAAFNSLRKNGLIKVIRERGLSEEDYMLALLVKEESR